MAQRDDRATAGAWPTDASLALNLLYPATEHPPPAQRSRTR